MDLNEENTEREMVKLITFQNKKTTWIELK